MGDIEDREIMDIHLTVRTDHRYESHTMSTQVPDVMVPSFKALRTTDDPLMTITGDLLAGGEKAEKVVTMRKDAAEYLSALLTDYLLDAMSKGDTFNGYRIEK